MDSGLPGLSPRPGMTVLLRLDVGIAAGGARRRDHGFIARARRRRFHRRVDIRRAYDRRRVIEPLTRLVLLRLLPLLRRAARGGGGPRGPESGTQKGHGHWGAYLDDLHASSGRRNGCQSTDRRSRGSAPFRQAAHSIWALMALHSSSIQPCGRAFSIMAEEFSCHAASRSTPGHWRNASWEIQAVSGSGNSALPAVALRTASSRSRPPSTTSLKVRKLLRSSNDNSPAAVSFRNTMPSQRA